MAKKKWIAIPGGRIKRWKRSESESGCRFAKKVPPHWYRNYLNRRERRRSLASIQKNECLAFHFVHPRTAGWYW
jgi:hypothetical protein